LQAARDDHLPRQQYWSVSNRPQADMQPTTFPPALTSSTRGQATA
jgi:hypothetical protein